MDLTLTAEECELLLNMIERRQQEIETEISHTDHHHEFRALLRHHQELVESLAGRLRAGQLQDVG